MLEIMNILEGGEPQARNEQTLSAGAGRGRRAQPVSVPEKITAPNEKMPVSNDDFSDFAAERKPDMKEAVARAVHLQEESAADTIDFAENLGGGDFAKLLSAIASKPLVFGAALLNTDIYEEKDENGKSALKLDFGGKLTTAESFLSAPHNNKVLSDAVYKVWGVGSPPQNNFKSEDTVSFNDKPADAGLSSAGEKAEKNDLNAAARATDSQMMLKLMGAELLYQKSLHEDENGEEKTE